MSRLCQAVKEPIDAMPTDHNVVGPRRQPRGLRRIQSILDAAEQVIDEGGYESATTNRIAAKAGVSPGSLYQYFTNKSDVVEALAQRYLIWYAEVRGAAVTPRLGDRPIPEAVDQWVDPLIEFNMAHPAAKFLLAGADLSPELAVATKDLHAALRDQVEILVWELAPRRLPKERQLAATLSIQILSGSLPAILASSPGDRALLVRELKVAIGGYWAAIASA